METFRELYLFASFSRLLAVVLRFMLTVHLSDSKSLIQIIQITHSTCGEKHQTKKTKKKDHTYA